LDGGIEGNNWGWLYCNRLIVLSSGSYINGSLDVYGSLNVYGSKNFIHPHPTDDTKVVRYIATESSEALTLTRGTAKTVNGEVTIKLPEHFSLVTSNNAPITVIVTPKGAPVLLYTKEESKNQIVVAMKKSDFTEFRDVEFAYQVTGVRDGFENQDVIIDAKVLYSPDFKDNWENTEVGKKIKVHSERIRAWQEKEKEEAYKYTK
jgi:hypothetical protein